MQEDYPKISIVTPTFNQGAFIEETIKSVINQHYPNLQFIIIDGGSTDGTIDIIKKYEQHIDYWVSEADEGQSAAINKGLAKCTGIIFNWLNSDDVLEKGALLKIGKEFKKPKVKLVTGVTKILKIETGELKLYTPELHTTLAKTISRPCFHQPSTYILTEYVKKFGGVSNLLHYGMDMELYTKYLIELGQDGIVVLDMPIATFQIHSESKTGTSHNIFIGDIASVFYSMAVKNNLNDLADKIMLISDELKVDGYQFKYDLSRVDEVFIKSIIENYIYKYINLYYDGTLKNMKKSAKLIKHFNGGNLENKDQKIINKIKRRISFIPLIAFYKKIVGII